MDLDAAGLGLDVSSEFCLAIGTELPELFGDEWVGRREGRRADMITELLRLDDVVSRLRRGRC